MGVLVDTRGAARRSVAIGHAAAGVASEIVLAHGEAFVRAANFLARRDTRRYVRGWQMAGRDVGVWSLIEPVRVSAWASRHIDRLEWQIRQVEGWIRVYEDNAAEKRRLLDLWFTSRGRRLTPAARRLKRDAAKFELKAEKLYLLLARAENELNKYLQSDAPIVMYAGQTSRSRGGRQKDGTVRKSRRRRLTTVRDKIYGGEGRVRQIGQSGAVLVLHNKEAHANIVESRYGTVRKARQAAMSAMPARRIGRRALAELELAAGNPV